ncbi:MAG: RHS repeat-associated core domain-containing protein [Kiritimatiellia bacterium]
MKTECKASSPEEPGAGIPHAGIRAGGARQRASLPRYITAYVDENGTIVAEYTYDAFGRTIAATGSLADAFRHRFSTKYYDAETGLYYYGYRFYAPELMRWLNRDPIGEAGGDSLYIYCGNNPSDNFDSHGHVWVVNRKAELPYAIAIANHDNDNFDDLAELLGLDSKDYTDWAHTSDSSAIKCKEYKIPNTIYYQHGQLKLHDHVFSNIINIWRNQNLQQADLDRESKFHVIWQENVADNAISEALGNPYLYQYIFTGHGALDGIINSYKSEGIMPGRYTKYGINLLRLNACGSADKGLVASKGIFYKYNEWEWNVAVRGKFVGYAGEINTFTEVLGWRITLGKNRKGY